jgi:hypothetical protein
MKRINGEPVKLVKSFGELRPGMIVWLAPCRECAGPVRTMLLNARRGRPRQPNGSLPATDIDVFATLHRHGRFDIVVSKLAVGRRIIYRVIDELMEQDRTGERTAKQLERVK